MNKIKKILVFVFLILNIVFLTSCNKKDIFKDININSFKIGDNYEEIINILGEPYEKLDSPSIIKYYSKEYINLNNKIKDYTIKHENSNGSNENKILNQLNKFKNEIKKIEYKYLEISFQDNKASKIIYDTKLINNTFLNKKLKNNKVLTEQIFQRSYYASIIYESLFEDDSFIKSYANAKVENVNDTLKIGNEVLVSWDDCYFDNYTTYLTVIDESNLYYEGDGFILDNQKLFINDNFSGDFNILLNDLCKNNVREIEFHKNLLNIEDYNLACFPNLIKVKINEGVKSIFQNAFKDCKSLSTIIIPSSINKIDIDAFKGCHRLVEIYNQSNLDIKVGSNALGRIGLHCKKINKNLNENSIININNDFVYYFLDNNYYFLNYVGNNHNLELPDKFNDKEYKFIKGCFMDNKIIRNVTLPSSINKIEDEMFLGCINLESINIGNNVTEIGINAFKDCILLKDINLPQSIKRIDTNAFYNCVSLKEINLPNNLFYLGESAFYRCINLKSITIPNNIATLSKFLFSECRGLEEIIINSNIEILPESIFYNCINLKAISLPNSINKIENKAFYNCVKLTNLLLPQNLEEIGNEVFLNCYNINNIILPSKLKLIGLDAFLNCYRLIEVYNLSSIKLENNKENGCVSYYSVIINTNIDSKSIIFKDELGFYYYIINNEYYLFNYDENNIIVELPIYINDKFYKLSDYAFYDKENISCVILPDWKLTIGKNSFNLCHRLLEIYNPSGINIELGKKSNGYIGYNALIVHKSLTEKSNIKILDDYVFYSKNKNYLINYIGEDNDLILPRLENDENYNIFNNAFKNKNITSVTFNETIIEIGRGAFYDAIGLIDVDFSNSITKIDLDAFAFCENIREINLPENLNTMGNCAFYECRNLEKVIIHKKVVLASKSIFEFCPNLTIYCCFDGKEYQDKIVDYFGTYNLIFDCQVIKE